MWLLPALLVGALMAISPSGARQVCLERADSTWGERNASVCNELVTMSPFNSSKLTPGDRNYAGKAV